MNVLQSDWTNDAAHPAVFWSGESQNGTVFMLVRLLSWPRLAARDSCEFGCVDEQPGLPCRPLVQFDRIAVDPRRQAILRSRKPFIFILFALHGISFNHTRPGPLDTYL